MPERSWHKNYSGLQYRINSISIYGKDHSSDTVSDGISSGAVSIFTFHFGSVPEEGERMGIQHKIINPVDTSQIGYLDPLGLLRLHCPDLLLLKYNAGHNQSINHLPILDFCPGERGVPRIRSG